jgi:multidrug efflux pump subunit AcrA (membrane-fusion protein)
VRQSAIVEARAEQTDADNGWTRAQALFKRDLATQAELDAAQARHDIVSARIAVAEQQLTAAQAELRVARAELAKTRIRAPFDGTVLRKNAEIGEMVAPVSARRQRQPRCDRHDREPRFARRRGGRQRGVIMRFAPGAAGARHDRCVTGHVVRGAGRQIVPTSDRQRRPCSRQGRRSSGLSRDSLPDMGAKVTFPGRRRLERGGRRLPVIRYAQAALQRDGNQVFVWLLGADRTVSKRSVATGPRPGRTSRFAAGWPAARPSSCGRRGPLRDGMRVRPPS